MHAFSETGKELVIKADSSVTNLRCSAKVGRSCIVWNHLFVFAAHGCPFCTETVLSQLFGAEVRPQQTRHADTGTHIQRTMEKHRATGCKHEPRATVKPLGCVTLTSFWSMLSCISQSSRTQIVHGLQISPRLLKSPSQGYMSHRE